MSFGIGPGYGMQLGAAIEYQNFKKTHSNKHALRKAAKHRARAAQYRRKGGKKGHKMANKEMAKAQRIEHLDRKNVNRAYMQKSIANLNNRWNNGFPGDDMWAKASFQARVKAAFGDFRATGGSAGEFQHRVLAGVQNPFFRTALLGHPGLS